MEPKHKELLDQCHQNLLDSITDADRLIELLIISGTLSQLDRFELDQNCSSSAEKVDQLLKMLVNKESDHFLELCVALEKTYPELYSALFTNGGGPVDHSSGSTYSVLSTMPSDSESSSSLSSVGSPPGTGNGSASSPPPALNDNRPAGDNLDTILFQLRQVTRERDELRKRLALASPGTTFDDCRPNSKASHDYERLKNQCMRAMADLQSLQNQHTKTLKRCEEAVKEADFYHMLHSRVFGDQSQLKEELEVLRRDHAQLVREHNHLKQSCEELHRLHSDDQKEVADMRLQQQEVMRENGSSDVLNKLYDTAMDKLEGVRKEHDSLSKRYGEKVANHNTDLSRLEQAEEENRRLQKQMDTLLKQRDKAIHYQQHCSTSMRRFDSVQQELDKSSAQNKVLQREMERLQSEVMRCKNFQLKAVKDCEKYKEERDSVFNEYRLIMSERDQVIKELEKLQTALEAAEARIKNTSSERMVASEETEALRQELNSSLVDRDRAICERNELLEKFCHEVKDKAEAQKELSQACKDIEAVREERDVARKERTEAIIQKEQLLREYYQARQKQDSATLDIERVNKEMEVLRKQYEAMSQELKEATQEAEVAKCRRDWAFQERDKIVAERESIRTLCDNLRRERDRAVSDLADALRNLDDMRKQKNDSSRELKEFKEKMESQLDKEGRFCQLMAHSSHDSAIDTDSLEWETEVVEFEKDRDDMDLKALGFDIAEGVNDPYLPGDCGIFVTRVDRGSIADGRLRVNDWLLKLNDVNLTNKDRKQVVNAVLNGGGLINMVVRRRKSLGGRLVTPIHINLIGHKDSGIGLESGVFVTALVHGSPATREGSLTVGDRLIAINGIALDNKSVTECETLLRNCRDSLSLSLMKFFPHSWSGQSIFESLRESSSNGRLSESYSNDDHSPEPREMLRSSPNRSHRQSVGFGTTVYNGTLPANSAHRGLAPCPAVTAVIRNPVYTVRSHRVHTNNCPSVSSQICQHQHNNQHHSPQHQGRLSLDLSQKRPAADYSSSSSRSSSTSHGTNSLPSSARLGLGWSSNVQYRTERIKIPSTPRYPRSMLGSDRGSLSHSECSSPSLITPPHSPLNLETSSFASSQSQSSISTLPRISVSPVTVGERSKDRSLYRNRSFLRIPLAARPRFSSLRSLRPYLEEPRNVIVHKGAEPLGISIVGGENGGIFVSKVTGGSIAHQAGLEYGDQLLEYNGINLRNATEQQARLIIGQQCDTITIMAQYNPHMYQLGNPSRSSSGLEPVSSQFTSQGSGATTPDNHSTIDTLSEQDEGTLTPSSKQTTPTTSPHSFIRVSSEGSRKVCEPRVVTVRRAQGAELGLGLCGGNLRGVYVKSLEEDSPARGPEGLQPGDLILEYGSVNMKNKTVEEMYVEMLKPAETVTLRVQQRPDDFNMVKDTPGDGFYIRALYERTAEAELDLSFQKDDILYVDDTLPKGSFGSWMVWQLDENAQRIQRGQIPSKYMMDQEFYRRHSMTELKDDKDSKSLSAAARRSFFRRKNKHKRSGSKDGKELVAQDAISTDSIPFLEDCVSLAYQRVQKVVCVSSRPVVILGPLSDPVKDMLVKESPGKFCRCVLEVMKASQQAIERGVKDCLFIDYKRRSGHFDVTTVASIKEITEKDCHCLLDIAPHAIERLHSVHIYPIVIFIRYKNAKQIKEQKDPVYLRDKVSQKHSKEQFEVAQKIEQEYSTFFTGIVQGGTLPYICTQIITIVDQEQSKVLWTPLGCP
ncbi:disks large homolog 5-like isoform X8 [Salvelinus fontinalis]|uniref:disks large homolog 5-like isoform X8 n=1 Tax=Salvelinus fontinalis TaxID=8038 RepID=UPI002485E67B|nr:disks large homolog 5-like isoform X8 [Salvelinus fontinalis]